MSNKLAIGAVTAVLKGLLDNELSQIPGITAEQTSVHPPDQIATDATEKTQLNLFLYHVTPNQGWRNVGLPSRNASGDRLTNPPLALDLHYLLTAYSRNDFFAEILLGYGMQVFHETPVLTPDSIRAKLSPNLPPILNTLLTSGLDQQVEQIKICPEGLDTEEMYRLWSAFQTHYRPTAAYHVSVVLIQSEQSTRSGLPVQQRNIVALPFRQPTIEQVISQAGAEQPITVGSILVILGQQMKADITEVQIGAISLPVQAPNLSDTRITIPLTSPPLSTADINALRAGVQPVQVIQKVNFGTYANPQLPSPTDPHRGAESNVMAFVLRPKIASSPTTPPPSNPAQISVSPVQTDVHQQQFRVVTVVLNLTVGQFQRVLLLLNQQGGGSGSYGFLAQPRNADTNSVNFNIIAVAAGTYFVRVQVDGAESPLDVDTNPSSPTFNQYTGTPNLIIPP